ncbi:hypothetical protein BGZ76_001960 [Entomortierella beljakovae]|nr:hypothetical protein BGZ76_001960 [Entomortierella beljakovae]
MTQILESTKNYLKNSTKLGRRMSGSRDGNSGSETSLRSFTHDSGLQMTKDSDSHQPTLKKRLSGVFTQESRSKSPTHAHPHSVSSDARTLSTKKSGDHKRPKTTKSNKSFHSAEGKDRDGTTKHELDHAEYLEDEVPRGRSPTLSMAKSFSTTTSTYDSTPSDYPSVHHYQNHVWRRTVLEESIMHSLRLGYGDRRRPSSRYHSRSSRRDSIHNRKSRDISILDAMSRELPPFPQDGSNVSRENITDRSLRVIDNGNRSQTFKRQMNGPYQLEYNSSMTNITQSFASFTLELPEHHASHVMASSAIPDLFRIKAIIPGVISYRPRSRRNSRSSLNGGIAPSPRVLSGKKPTIPLPKLTLPDVQDEEENDDPESPLTPTSATWASSVLTSLEVVNGSKENVLMKSQLTALEVAPATAV